MLKIAFLILILVFLNKQIYSLNNSRRNVDTEKILIDKLFKNYDKRLKPSDTVEIKFALNLNQIITLIEQDQIIVINVFLDHEWIDERLKWNPSEYNNISLLRINSEMLWSPDTFADTTADDSGFLLPQKGTLFLVQNTGLVFWTNPMSQMKIRCRMSIAWFPYDEQLCSIIFGSWSYTSNHLNYTVMHAEPSLKNFTDNQEWTLITYKPTRFEIKYEHWFDDQSFSEIKYKILIRRKSLFVVQNYVTPALILCTMTLVSFFIPFPQAMQIGISILLTFAVFKLRLSDDVPVQSDSVPLINIYFTLCISFSLSSMIWFSIINCLKEMKELPNYLRCFVLNFVCFIMCIKIENDCHKRRKTKCEGLVWIPRDSQLNLNKQGEFDLFRESVKLSIDSRENVKLKNNLDKKSRQIDDLLINILNKFIFYLFFVFICFLNLFCLVILPFYVKNPMKIDSD